MHPALTSHHVVATCSLDISFATTSLPAVANTSLKTIFELVFSDKEEIFRQLRICLRDKGTTKKKKDNCIVDSTKQQTVKQKIGANYSNRQVNESK